MLAGRILRRSLSSCVPYNGIEQLYDTFVRYTPQPVQRWGPVSPRSIEIFKQVYERDIERFGYADPAVGAG